MLFHQLLAIIIYSSWHYGKVYHDNQKGRLTCKESFSRVLLILIMSYLLFAIPLVFFIITFAKLIRDVFVMIFSPPPILFNIKNKQNLFDAMIGLTCCVVYTIG